MKTCFSCWNFGHLSTHCSVPEPCTSPGCRSRHHPLQHDPSIQYSGWNTSDTDRRRRRGTHCIGVAKPVNQSHNHFAKGVISEYNISLGVLPVQTERLKGCLETFALVDTGSDVTVAQRDLSVGRPQCLLCFSVNFSG